MGQKPFLSIGAQATWGRDPRRAETASSRFTFCLPCLVHLLMVGVSPRCLCSSVCMYTCVHTCPGSGVGMLESL